MHILYTGQINIHMSVDGTKLEHNLHLLCIVQNYKPKVLDGSQLTTTQFVFSSLTVAKLTNFTSYDYRSFMSQLVSSHSFCGVINQTQLLKNNYIDLIDNATHEWG